MAIKSKIMVLEPDRLFAKCVKTELESSGFLVTLVTNADQAISVADDFRPDLVVTELSLAGHSASEFLYEYRSYTDFSKIPVILYTSMKVDQKIRNAKDWNLLKLSKILYKPEDSLSTLAREIQSTLEQ